MHFFVRVIEIQGISLRNSLHSGSGVSREDQRTREGLNLFFLFSTDPDNNRQSLVSHIINGGELF